jgi:hypothetical protein
MWVFIDSYGFCRVECVEYERQQQKIANLQKSRNERAEQRYTLANGSLAERSKYQFE